MPLFELGYYNSRKVLSTLYLEKRLSYETDILHPILDQGLDDLIKF